MAKIEKLPQHFHEISLAECHVEAGWMWFYPAKIQKDYRYHPIDPIVDEVYAGLGQQKTPVTKVTLTRGMNTRTVIINGHFENLDNGPVLSPDVAEQIFTVVVSELVQQAQRVPGAEGSARHMLSRLGVKWKKTDRQPVALYPQSFVPQ